jgi:hypothetical protein
MIPLLEKDPAAAAPCYIWFFCFVVLARERGGRVCRWEEEAGGGRFGSLTGCSSRRGGAR